MATLMVESSTFSTSTEPVRSSSARENVRRSRTMDRTRSAPSRASAHQVRTRSHSSAEGACPRERRCCSSRSISSRPSVTYTSGLLISCATPAASVPMEAMRSARASPASIRLRSLASSTMPMPPRIPAGPWMGASSAWICVILRPVCDLYVPS